LPDVEKSLLTQHAADATRRGAKRISARSDACARGNCCLVRRAVAPLLLISRADDARGSAQVVCAY